MAHAKIIPQVQNLPIRKDLHPGTIFRYVSDPHRQPWIAVVVIATGEDPAQADMSTGKLVFPCMEIELDSKVEILGSLEINLSGL